MLRPMKIQSIAVYCASGEVLPVQYREAARAFGRLLARREIRLIYGGGRVGLMAELADATLSAGGEVVGVIPEHLQEREQGHSKLTRLIRVKGMAARKLRMAEEADAFVALPGGFGTWDELFDVITRNIVGELQKPVGLLNPGGFWDPLLGFLERCVRERVVMAPHARFLKVSKDPEALIKALLNSETVSLGR